MISQSMAKAVEAEIDNIFLKDSRLSRFSRIPSRSGIDVAKYYSETDSAQREIILYRDKNWSKQGGTVYLEMRCLVPQIQCIFYGYHQSLIDMGGDGRALYFQWGQCSEGGTRSWDVSSQSQLTEFGTHLGAWLPSSGMDWFEQFETLDGAVSFLIKNGMFLVLAVMEMSYGNRNKARGIVAEWFKGLPRTALEACLKLLCERGIITEGEVKELQRASLQAEEVYRQAVERWASLLNA